MRYGEQVFEIPVPLDGVDWDSPGLATILAERFHAMHERLYTYALRDQEVVLVNVRLSVIGRLPQANRAVVSHAPAPNAEPKGQRLVYLDGWRQVPVFDFLGLVPDQSVPGPAIIESDTTTVLLRPGDTARFDARLWLDVAVRQSLV
jgi:N-methylhydantoinase A